MAKAAAKYWVPHKDHVWIIGRLMTKSADKATLSVGDGDDAVRMTMPIDKFDELVAIEPDQEAGVDDICSLTTVVEASLLHTVRLRYARDLIYTRSMRVLIAVNPFRSLPIYSTQHVDQFMAAADSLDLPPHIFGIGQDAIRGLRSTENDQAILISGESGAGKTESAKLILSFVAESVRSSGTSAAGIEEQVMLTNPVLEAFGNAMTVRNKNSSRFGKWLDLQYASHANLTGCMLTSYLLETTRVCSQSKNERGYHVFFQLLQARKSTEFSDLGLDDAMKYNYLKNGSSVVPGMNDARNFQELQDALTALKFDDYTQKELFKVVAAILTLGNCDIVADGSDASKIVDLTPVNQAAKLLGVDTTCLKTCLLIKRMVVGKDVTEAPLRVEQAKAVRDGLARLLYGRLFLWMIQKMNDTLGAYADRSEGKQRLLGILDIAGFENFDMNSLEQFLINLSNEHLQQRFNTVMIKEDVEDCLNEGVTVPDAGNFEDNADCLAFIDGKGGVLDLLDETMTMPKADESSFVAKVAKQDHKRYVVAKGPKSVKCGFGIQHYAGAVIYNCEGWLEKNADRPPDSSADMLKGSSLWLLQEIGGTLDAESAVQASPRGPAKKIKSVSSGFRASMKALMAKISTADPHYIRCIKPNKEKIAGKFSSQMVMEQLILGGVLATVKIRQQGYAYRMSHMKFIHNYACVKRSGGTPTLLGVPSSAKDLEMVVGKVSDLVPSGALVIGNTKVFIKMDAFKILEEARERALFDNVVLMQSNYRGFAARRQAQQRSLVRDRCCGLVGTIKLGGCSVGGRSSGRASTRTSGRMSARARGSSVAGWTGEGIITRFKTLEAVRSFQADLDSVLLEAKALHFRQASVLDAEKVKSRLQLEMEAVSEAESICNSFDIMTVEKVIARVSGLNIASFPIIKALDLDDRLSKLKAQMPLVKAMQSAIDEYQSVHGRGSVVMTETRSSLSYGEGECEAGEEGDRLKKVVDAVKGMGLDAGSAKWLPDLGGEQLFEKASKLLEAWEWLKQEQEEEARKAAAEIAAHAREKEAAELAACKPRLSRGSGSKLELPDAAQPQESRATWTNWFWQKVTPGKREPKAKGTASADEQNNVSEDKEVSTAAAPEDGEAVLNALLRSVSLLGKLDREEWETIADGLRRGMEECDANALEDYLRQALEAGMPADGLDITHRDSDDDTPATEDVGSLVSLARQTFDKLQKEEFLILSLADIEEELETSESSTIMLKRLENIIRQVEKMPGLQDEANEARDLLQRKMATMCIERRHALNQDEIDLAARTFGDLKLFSGLKLAASWGGGRSDMLNHSKVCIPESLLRVPVEKNEEEYDAEATQNFRDILVSMGDTPAQECQRQASFNAVLDRAMSDSSMCDEVYVQLLKQLTSNPSVLSAQLGWKLLQSLCKQSRPGDELFEFARHFLNRLAEIGESVSASRSCLMELDRLDRAPVRRDSADSEIGGLSSALTGMDNQVKLIESQADVSIREAKAEKDQSADDVNGNSSVVVETQAETKTPATLKSKGKGKGKHASVTVDQSETQTSEGTSTQNVESEEPSIAQSLTQDREQESESGPVSKGKSKGKGKSKQKSASEVEVAETETEVAETPKRESLQESTNACERRESDEIQSPVHTPVAFTISVVAPKEEGGGILNQQAIQLPECADFVVSLISPDGDVTELFSIPSPYL